MNRKFVHRAVLALLFVLFFLSSLIANERPATKSSRPKLTVSVHDYADVPTELLAAAEREAHRIFHQAGVDTVWLNCSARKEKTQPAGCYIVDSTHLVLKVSPHAMSAQVRDRIEVLGIATLDEKGVGLYAYVFYDRIQNLTEERRLEHRLLSVVFAHEIGHLLLGSISHSISGIMSEQFSGEGFRRVSEGAMLFTPVESRKMRNRLGTFE